MRRVAGLTLPAVAPLVALLASGGGVAEHPIGAPAPARMSGAPEISVRYPQPGQRIVPDSNFLFGSVGSGSANLEIDGRPVEVAANGAFLAWLPVPSPTRGETAFYRLAAWEDADTARLTLAVLRPRVEPPAGAPSPWLDTEPLETLPERWIRPGESWPLEVVGERGAEVHLQAGVFRVPLDETPARGTLSRYGARVDLAALRTASCRAGGCRTPPRGASGEGGPGVRVDSVSATLVARKSGDVRRIGLRLPLAVLDEGALPRIRLAEAPDTVNGASGVVVARPTPYGPYQWRLPNGTVTSVTGRLGDRARIRLEPELEAWVLAEDVEWWASGPPLEPARVLDGRATRTELGADLRFGLSRAVPVSVAVTGERSLRLILHDALGTTDRIAHGAGTGVRSVRWAQRARSVRIDVELDHAVWGYRPVWERGDAAAYEGPRGPMTGVETEAAAGGGDGAAAGTDPVLRLSIRRPPAIRADSPIEGRTIAIDPGHPGGGSYGPTGLYEGDANLAIARRLAGLVEEAGGTPALVRTGSGAVGLYERTDRARRAGADLLVSIHNNALPDGVRPFDRAGTTTYYHHPHSAPLARAVQRELVGRLGLPDLGVVWGDLAIPREPWMPTVLVEGAFMMMPSHEAALRTEAFRERYARGVLEGIEAFLRVTADPVP